MQFPFIQTQPTPTQLPNQRFPQNHSTGIKLTEHKADTRHLQFILMHGAVPPLPHVHLKHSEINSSVV